jgi:hypothetical protein
METQTAPAARPSSPGQHPLPCSLNTPCHLQPISAIFQDPPNSALRNPNICGIIDSMETQTAPAARPSNPGRLLPPCRNTPCHSPPISAIFQDLGKRVSGFPHFCAIIDSMETQTGPAARPSNPGRLLPPCRNTPCHRPPISAIFQDLGKRVSDFPNFRAIIGSAAYTPYQEDAKMPKPSSPPGPGPRSPAHGGERPWLPPKPPHRHPPGEISTTLKHPPDRCAPQPVSTGFLCQPCVSTRGGHAGAPCPRPAATPRTPSSPAHGGEGPLFPKKSTTSQPSKQTSPGPAPDPQPRGGRTFVSKKKHHIAAFETNIPRPHRPPPAPGTDLCFSEKPPHRSLRAKHPLPPLPRAVVARLPLTHPQCHLQDTAPAPGCAPVEPRPPGHPRHRASGGSCLSGVGGGSGSGQTSPPPGPCRPRKRPFPASCPATNLQRGEKAGIIVCCESDR